MRNHEISDQKAEFFYFIILPLHDLEHFVV